MAQGLHQVQSQTQQMVLAPQLRQSLKILQVSALELRNAILEELQSNPTLEELPLDEISIDGEKPDQPAEAAVGEGEGSGAEAADWEAASAASEAPVSPENGEDENLDFAENFEVFKKLDQDWRDYFQQESGEMTFSADDAQRRQHFFDSLTGDTSLQQDLLEQARMVESNAEVLSALEYLIGSLNDHGFLTAPVSEVALMSQLPLRTVQEASQLLKTLDPPGIGAEDLRECLLIQLRVSGHGKSLAARIVRDYWELLLRRRLPEIARKCSATLDDVQEALQLIAKLDPAPGRRFSDDNNQIVEPDVTVEQDEDGEWQVILHNDYIPRLRLSSSYKQLLAKGRLSKKELDYLNEKFRSGKFLISSIEQRQQTIEQITRVLLRFQRDFFDHGTAQLRPLTMNQVAEEVGVHETTISRAIANKYIRTPHGLFPFKFFFTPGFESADGQSFSNKSIKERLQKLIESEPPAKPFSDQALAKMLGEEGIKIARRTVAKYREELGILPTNLRRHYN